MPRTRTIHTVASNAHMWRDQGQTTMRPGHCCMMSDDRAYSLNALQLAVSGDRCGEARPSSLSRGRCVEVPPCLSLSPTIDQRQASDADRQTNRSLLSISLALSWPYTNAQPLQHHHSQAGQSPDHPPGPDLLAPSSCTARTHAPALLLLHAATTQLAALIDLPR